MMRITAVFTIAVAAAALAATEPHVDLKVQKLEDGRTAYAREVYLNQAKLRLKHTTNDGKTTLSKKRGDLFFGLEFGRLPRSSGSWGLSEFFRCYERQGKICNLVRERVPTMVTACAIGGIAVADLEFPSMDGGRLRLRMMQFPSHPEWLFLRVTAEDFIIWRLDFQAYPCNSDDPVDRERHVRTEHGDANLKQETVKIHETTGPFLALYNKFMQETAGNFLIIQPEKFRLLEIPKCGAAVNIRLHPKKGVSQFDFALGYFKDRPAADAVSRLFDEDGDAVRNFMEGINWNPQMSTADFDRSLAEARRLGVAEATLAPIRKTYHDAVKKGDVTTAARAESQLNKLKQAAVAAGLADFM